MRKVILSVMVAGALMATSCKDAKKTEKEVETKTEKVVSDAANKAKEVVDTHSSDMADSAETEAVKKLDAALAVAKGLGIDIPSFDNPKLTQNLADYAVYAKEYIAAKGNTIAITKLAPKGAELLKQGQDLLKGADTDTVKKFKTVLTALQSKMAPAK